MKGDEYWAWQTRGPTGEWSTVGALIGDDDNGIHMPLMVRERELVDKVRSLAESHSAAVGEPLRLAHFTLAEVEEP